MITLYAVFCITGDICEVLKYIIIYSGIIHIIITHY